jgi:hypothetical protein
MGAWEHGSMGEKPFDAGTRGIGAWARGRRGMDKFNVQPSMFNVIASLEFRVQCSAIETVVIARSHAFSVTTWQSRFSSRFRESGKGILSQSRRVRRESQDIIYE